MLMGIVWIGVIGAGTNAKAMAFMYSEVVAATASLRHDGVLQTPPAGSVGMRSASCVVLAMSHCQVSSMVEKMFIHLITQWAQIRWPNTVSPKKQSPLYMPPLSSPCQA